MPEIFTHVTQAMEAIGLLHAAALIIVNITPTPKDNEFLGRAHAMGVRGYRLIEILAGVVTPLVKK